MPLSRRALTASLLALSLSMPALAQQVAPPLPLERSAVHTLRATSTGRTYDIYVKLPPNYGAPENAGRRYPVIYLTDGDYTFQVASGVTRLPHNAGKLEQAILVGLPNAKGEDGMAARRRDLTPWENPAMPGPNGGGRAYVEFITGQVLPLIDATYRSDPARRTFVGQSYGGLLGLWILFSQPQHFSSYLLTSPSIWYAEKALMALEANYAKNHKELKARLFMATGAFEGVKKGTPSPRYNKETDMVGDQQKMARWLRGRGYKGFLVQDMVIPATIHETTFPIGLVYGLQWLYGQDQLDGWVPGD